MPEYYKSWPDGWAYFATLTLVGWIDLFTRRACADVVLDSLRYSIANKELSVWAWVLMPSLLHIIAGVPPGQRLGDVLGDVKSFTTRKLLAHIAQDPQESRREWLQHLFQYFGRAAGQAHQVWQPGGHYIALDSAELAERARRYIHENPVKAGYVYDAGHYALSSAAPELLLPLADW